MLRAQKERIINTCKQVAAKELSIPETDILDGNLIEYSNYCNVEFAVFSRHCCRGGYADRIMVCYSKTRDTVDSLAYFKPTIQKGFPIKRGE